MGRWRCRHHEAGHHTRQNAGRAANSRNDPKQRLFYDHDSCQLRMASTVRDSARVAGAQTQPPVAVRLRRDFDPVLGLIEAHARLHRATREQDSEGRIVATFDDYAVVRALVIDLLSEGLQVSVSDEILFSTGSATLNQEGREVLAKVAEQLASLDHLIEVRGHTDNLPIHGALAQRYPSNWELAGARASSVVRLFRRQGIDGERLSAVSKGEFEPLASNDTEEERWLNRRIEIRLLPRAEEELSVPFPSPPTEDASDDAADAAVRSGDSLAAHGA